MGLWKAGRAGEVLRHILRKAALAGRAKCAQKVAEAIIPTSSGHVTPALGQGTAFLYGVPECVAPGVGCALYATCRLFAPLRSGRGSPTSSSGRSTSSTC